MVGDEEAKVDLGRLLDFDAAVFSSPSLSLPKYMMLNEFL